MPTLKNLRTWRNDLTLDVGDDAERAQRAERDGVVVTITTCSGAR